MLVNIILCVAFLASLSWALKDRFDDGRIDCYGRAVVPHDKNQKWRVIGVLVFWALVWMTDPVPMTEEQLERDDTPLIM